MNKKIIFAGFMATVLISASANAAQIASKQYVDNLDTAQAGAITTAITTAASNYATAAQGALADSAVQTPVMTNAIADAVSGITTNVAAKADKKVPATAGNIAGLDASGNLTDSGIAAGTVGALQSGAATMQTAITAVEDAVDGLGALADLNTVSTAVIDDASVTKPKLSADVQTSLGLADTALQSAAISGKEDITNKSTNITTDTGSTTKYTTVSAVEAFAIPKPGANCTGAQAHCVLSVDKGTGNIFWEDIAM